MAFFLSVLWALFSFGAPGFSAHPGAHVLPVAGHHHHGGMQVMDGSAGGPPVGG